MSADRTSAADTGAEDLDVTPAPERRPPPDTPGAADVPSRADSRAGAAAANETADGQSGTQLDEVRPETASPIAEPADEKVTVGSESEPSGQAADEPNEQSAATPHEHGAEAEPGNEAAKESSVGEDASDADLVDAAAKEAEESVRPKTVVDVLREPHEEPVDEQADNDDTDAVPEPVTRQRPEAKDAAPRPEAAEKPVAGDRAAGIWGTQDSGSSADTAFWAASADQAAGSTAAASDLGHEDRPDTAAERPVYPEVTDRSDYAFTDREYDFAGVSPQQAWDMHERRAPLGTEPELWNTCVGELHEVLAVEGIVDADVRLKGSAARFCAENPKKGFPQTEDDLRARVGDHYRNAPADERTQRVENAAATYREAGFDQDGAKPTAPFFDSMYKLDTSNDLSDYDFHFVSDGLAERFRQLEKSEQATGWRSEHGGHYKHRHLERVAPALHDWAGRWEGILGRDVTIATFDHRGPSTVLHDSDWQVIEPEEQTDP